MNEQTKSSKTTNVKKTFKKEDFTTFSTGAQKELSGKLRTDLITPESEEALARVYTYGATKYADRNWEKGISFMTLVGALKRHLLKFLKGVDVDDESGLLHTDHMAFYTAALSTFMERGRFDLDDRPAVVDEYNNSIRIARERMDEMINCQDDSWVGFLDQDNASEETQEEIDKFFGRDTNDNEHKFDGEGG